MVSGASDEAVLRTAIRHGWTAETLRRVAAEAGMETMTAKAVGAFARHDPATALAVVLDVRAMKEAKNPPGLVCNRLVRILKGTCRGPSDGKRDKAKLLLRKWEGC